MVFGVLIIAEFEEPWRLNSENYNTINTFQHIFFYLKMKRNLEKKFEQKLFNSDFRFWTDLTNKNYFQKRKCRYQHTFG